MNTIKCFNCGVTNWASAENCVRCKNKLESNAEEFANYQSQPASRSYQPAYDSAAESKSFLRSPIAIVLLVIVGLGGYYFIFLKSSPQSPTKTSSDSTSTDVPAEVALAAPPAGMKVTPPNLSNFKTLVQNEINQSNSNEISTVKSAPAANPYAAPTVDMKAAQENWQKAQEEARRRLGPCDATINNCQELLNQRKNEMIREQNNREEFFGSSRTKTCPPQIQGEIKPVEPGKYHQFDDQIYFVIKVRADGLEGYEENQQCAYKPAIAGLTAQIYLKWQGSSYGLEEWQASSKLEMQNVSLAHQKKKKEEADAKREAARREKTRPPGSGIF